MSVNNDSDFYTPDYTPTSDGSYGEGWVWGGGDAGWSYQGVPEATSPLAQTIIAALQQQQFPPQEDWFAQANSMAMAAMVAAQTSSATGAQQAAAAPATYEPEPSPVVSYGWMSSGDGPDQWVPVTTWYAPPAPSEPAPVTAQATAAPTPPPAQPATAYGWVSSGDGPDQLSTAGDGARGIVFGSRGPNQAGHVFNVVNQNGVVRFLDGQNGHPASIGGYQSLHLLRTN